RPDCFHLDMGVDAGRGPQRLVLSFVPPRVYAKGQDYAMRAELCRVDGRRCVSVPGAEVAYFGADQPRIRAEVRIPWRAPGVYGVQLAIGVSVGSGDVAEGCAGSTDDQVLLRFGLRSHNLAPDPLAVGDPAARIARRTPVPCARTRSSSAVLPRGTITRISST